MTTGLQSLPSGEHEASESANILIVDDEEYARTTLMDVLEEMGYRVQGAGTGAEALALARATLFDIALLDLRLPDMKGTDLLTQMKSICPETACIMVTAYASLDTSLYALNQGASGYVQKPFEMPEIIRVIREQIEKQRLSRENRRMMQALQALQSISDIALSTPEPRALPARLLERFVQATGGHCGALCLSGDEDHVPPIRVGESDGVHALQVMRSGAPSLIPPGTRAPCLAVPLRVRGEAIGGIEVVTTNEQGFTHTDLELAELLADRTALALENARLHERERLAARESQTLHHVAEALVSALHLDHRLHIIARTLAEVAGCERCLVFLLQRGKSLMPARAYGVTADEAETFSEMSAEVLATGGSVARALETGKPVLLSDLSNEPEACRSFLGGIWRMRSGLVLPLIVGSSVTGAALVDTPGRDLTISPRDIRLCEAVSNQAAVAIENARTFERERNIAEVLQKSFLPTVPERIGQLRLAARYHAALSEASVGGDFYDWMHLPDGRIGILMADVSGKGVRAALHAAMGRYMLRAYAFEHPNPADALRYLNLALLSYSSLDVFITMFFAAVDGASGEIEYASAGHPPALLIRGSDPNRMVRLGSTGAPIGAFREATFTGERVRMAPSDMLVLYTDGVTEARVGCELFGIERLEDVVAESAREGPEATADAIHAAVQAFTGKAARDDIALIIAQAAPSLGS
ncbi:MAG TPA: SpoIIE family protein phosphatase [Armatimonadota bacterium]|nr:SpoIIE family protein phosphatase [Armatimonadota bacterium]